MQPYLYIVITVHAAVAIKLECDGSELEVIGRRYTA